MIKLNLKFDTSAFKGAAQVAARSTFRSVLTKISEKIKFLMRLPKSGRTYGTHRASAPGQAPGIRTGTLLGSIGEPTYTALSGMIRISAPYAQHLESGTSTVKARPFARPAVDGVLADIKRGGTLRNLL